MKIKSLVVENNDFFIILIGIAVGFFLAKTLIDIFLDLPPKQEDDGSTPGTAISRSRECILHTWIYNTERRLLCSKCGKRPS